MNFLLAGLSYSFLVLSFYYSYNTEILKTLLCIVVYLTLSFFRRHNEILSRVIELEKMKYGHPKFSPKRK